MTERTQQSLMPKPPTPTDTPSPARMLLTVSEVAAELGCCRDTVYTLLATGDLPSVRISERLRRIRRTDLRSYVQSLATSTPQRRGDHLGRA